MKRNHRFLVVDDDKPTRTLLRKILGEFGHVEIAERGVSGLMKYRDFIKATTPFHLVTLDMTLPQMDGVTMLECMRGLEMVYKVRPRSKILMLSGTDNRQTIIEALNMGSNGYLLKPIERGRIEEKVRELLRLPKQAARPRGNGSP